MEEYLLDLTKPYHNLLELRRGERRQTFYWDMNVSAMEDENRIIQYYLSDEQGSPLRVLYRNGNGDAYGYDEFGVDLYDPEAEQYGGKRYSRQGERQPFGYTGYRRDDISGTYFAQAREYQPEAGRFVAEDVVRGRNTIPKTLNRYGYCWGNPVQYVDLNGENPITAYLSKGQKLNRLKELSKMYTLFAPVQATYKESQSLKGLAKMRYSKEYKDSLSKYPELRERMQSLLQNGEKITSKQWKAEIQSLQSECDSIGREQTKTAAELAYAEVISYNRKKFNVNFIVKTGVFLYNRDTVGASCIVSSVELQQ